MDIAGELSHTPAVAGEKQISSLILAELYETGDASFVDRVVNFQGSFKPLVNVIERWKKDRSTRARRMRLAFVEDSRLTTAHRVVFKRLFKQAWHDRDHALMAAFLHRLDGSIRRRRAKRVSYANRTYNTYEVLRVSPHDGHSIFSIATTHYLRRRAWRYFRRLGFMEPSAYTDAVWTALTRYTDDDVRLGQNLLDNWGLMHACFGKSPLLNFVPRHTNLKPDSPLAELSAAPMFERLWAEPTAAAVLLKLLLDANCRPVRVWAIQLLKRHHNAALASIDADLLLRLLDHQDGDVAIFAAELLSNAVVVAALPVNSWLRLLVTRNSAVVAVIVEAFRNHVKFDRVTVVQAVEIATSIAAPVARLGLEILQSWPAKPADRDAIAELAAARCAAVAGAIGRFAVERLNVAAIYSVEQLIAFFDSAVLTLRVGAFAALSDDSPAGADPAFWAALLESPYDDVRGELVGRLKHRQSLPGAGTDALARLWELVLLNIHRGGRAKLSALMQISRQIKSEPETAALLLPVLAVAIRSVRPPEARHGLSALVSAVEAVPELADQIVRWLPELRLDAMGAAT